MALWEVRDRDQSVQVSAPNWMMAVGSASEALGGEPLDLACLICEVQDDGVVRIVDSKSERALLVRKADEDESDSEQTSPEAEAASDDDTSGTADGDAPPAPPALSMPEAPSSSMFGDITVADNSSGFDAEDIAFVTRDDVLPDKGEAPEDLAEQLFDAGMDIASADSPAEACAAAIALLQRFVPAESACVLGAGINDTRLRFLAVTGPSADNVKNMTVPFESGIAGFCHSTGADVIIVDAAADPRHHSDVDASSGYRTQSVLAVALRDSDGDIHGCIELLNPPGGFQPWHMDAARSVAHTLADFLGPRI